MISVSGFLSSGTLVTNGDGDDETNEDGERADMSSDFLAAGLIVSTEGLFGTILSAFNLGSSEAEMKKDAQNNVASGLLNFKLFLP